MGLGCKDWGVGLGQTVTLRPSFPGETGSRVTAHFDPEEGVLAASIVAKGEHYFIEPSRRHIKQSHDFHMISYRASDLKHNITRYG